MGKVKAITYGRVWNHAAARQRIELVVKLTNIPELSDQYDKLFNMIYSSDKEICNLAENIITKKADYEKTKYNKTEN